MTRKAEKPVGKVRKTATKAGPEPPAEKTGPGSSPSGKTETVGKPAAGKKQTGKALSRKRSPQIAREMLTVEMRRVRSLFVEIGERYLADTEGRIVAVIDDLEKRKMPMPCVERLLKDVRALNVKPRKGRLKDLGRISTLVDAIRKTLEE